MKNSQNKSIIHKILSVGLILTFLVLFSSCGKQEHNTSVELSSSSMPDFQYMFTADGVLTPTQKSNSGYYNVVSNRIIYTDAKTLNSTPLCNKSDCLHTSAFPDCNAKIKDISLAYHNFQIYKDKIYYLMEDLSGNADEEKQILKCVSLDGSEQDTAITLQDKFVVDWFIYDGYFYYQPNISIDDDSSHTKSGNFYRIDLSAKSEELFIDFSKLENIYGAEGSLRNIYDGFMYVTLSGFSSEDAYNKMMSGEDFDGDASAVRKIARYDLSDGSCTIIDPYDNDYEFAGFSDGKLVGTDYNADGETKKICISELDGTNPTVASEISIRYQVTCDDNYIYLYNLLNASNDERKTVIVYDKDGKKLSTAYLPDDFDGITIAFYDDYIWFQTQSNLCVIEKSQLLNDGTELTYREIYKYE